MWKASRHQVDSLEDLEGPNLLSYVRSVELNEGIVFVGSNASNKMRFGVNQGSEQVVQPRVKVLSQRGNRFFSVQQLVFRIGGRRRRRDSETDSSSALVLVQRNRMLSESFDLVSEEVSRETELTIFARKDGNDVVRYDVTICVEEVGRVIDDLKIFKSV
jgi:ribosomal protein L27